MIDRIGVDEGPKAQWGVGARAGAWVFSVIDLSSRREAESLSEISLRPDSE